MKVDLWKSPCEQCSAPEERCVAVHERQCSNRLSFSGLEKDTVQGNTREFCKTITGMEGNPLPVQELGAFLVWWGNQTGMKQTEVGHTSGCGPMKKSLSEVAVVDARGL